MPLFGNLFRQRSPFPGMPAPNGGERRPMDERMPGTDNWYDPLPENKSPGFFSPGSKAMQILGVVGDALQAGSDGRQGTYIPAMLDLQQQTERERQQLEMYERKRSDDWADFQREFDYRAKNTAPDVPPMIRDARAWQTMTPEEREALTNVERLRNPPPYFTGADGGSYQRPDPYAPAPGTVVPAPWAQQPPAQAPGGAAPSGMPPFSGKVGYDQFKRAIIGQETGGRYGVPNAQGSGAMGVGQVMPATARTLAARIGQPYRPDLMAGTGADARQYQDAITEAATREAWEAGGAGSDPRTSAMYYHGGSNRNVWGPKTRRYADQILGRMRGS